MRINMNFYPKKEKRVNDKLSQKEAIHHERFEKNPVCNEHFFLFASFELFMTNASTRSQQTLPLNYSNYPFVANA